MKRPDAPTPGKPDRRKRVVGAGRRALVLGSEEQSEVALPTSVVTEGIRAQLDAGWTDTLRRHSSVVSTAVCPRTTAAPPETGPSVFGVGTDSSPGGDRLRSSRLPGTDGRPDSEKRQPLHARRTLRSAGRGTRAQPAAPRDAGEAPRCPSSGLQAPGREGEARSLGRSLVLNSEGSVFIYHGGTSVRT